MSERTLHRPAPTLASGHDGVALSAADAGWTYCGLVVTSLDAGESRMVQTGEVEMIVLPLGGAVDVELDGQRFSLGGRDDVFSAVTDWAYLPIDAEVRLTSSTGCELALPSAKATARASSLRMARRPTFRSRSEALAPRPGNSTTSRHPTRSRAPTG